jgi:hypothetical protein
LIELVRQESVIERNLLASEQSANAVPCQLAGLGAAIFPSVDGANGCAELIGELLLREMEAAAENFDVICDSDLVDHGSWCPFGIFAPVANSERRRDQASAMSESKAHA